MFVKDERLIPRQMCSIVNRSPVVLQGIHCTAIVLEI